MKEIHFSGVFLFLFIFTVIAVSAKQWKHNDWDKHVTPQKGIHYQWPKHPKTHTEYWRTFHPHHNEKQTKEMSKQSHHSISHHEAKFQSHFKPNKKHNQKHFQKWEREDLHLQDLNLERQIKERQRAHRGSHSPHNDGHHEVERIVTHHPGHLNKEPWMKYEHNKHTKAFSHAQVDHHHSHRKNHKNTHHKNHKQGDKPMKNKRKKAHEKKFNKKHNKKHFTW
ncbi:sex-determining region Y protein-like [Centruroides vittatus]|uniref:sex-determining region Y protein-like n=1 Tax=Centruroides vittatus TaxID=120091 RepID=UPI00350FEC2C